MNNSGNIVARIAYAALAGIVAFIIVLFVGFLIAKLFDPGFGDKVESLAAIIGLLVAILYFFARYPRRPLV